MRVEKYCKHNLPMVDTCTDCMVETGAKEAPDYTLTVLEKILTELQRISSLLEKGNSNTGLKRPGATKFGRK